MSVGTALRSSFLFYLVEVYALLQIVFFNPKIMFHITTLAHFETIELTQTNAFISNKDARVAILAYKVDDFNVFQSVKHIYSSIVNYFLEDIP